MTPLENGIADSMEESLQPYILSDEYQAQKTDINQKMVEFRKGLNEAQQKEFNQLMDMLNDVDDVNKVYTNVRIPSEA